MTSMMELRIYDFDDRITKSVSPNHFTVYLTNRQSLPLTVTILPPYYHRSIAIIALSLAGDKIIELSAMIFAKCNSGIYTEL